MRPSRPAFGSELSLVLDGDLPKSEWFSGAPAPRLSDRDGEVHTVCVGRPFGIFPDLLAELATHGVHTHFHGPTSGDWWAGWIREARHRAPRHVHLHTTVRQPDWLRVLSRYDAGWLHVFRSRNEGELRRACWDDLNIPARVGTYAVAGLPLLQPDHGGSLVATQTLARDLGVGVFFRDVERFALELYDQAAMERRRELMWHARHEFAFDQHVEELVALFPPRYRGARALGWGPEKRASQGFGAYLLDEQRLVRRVPDSVIEAAGASTLSPGRPRPTPNRSEAGTPSITVSTCSV